MLDIETYTKLIILKSITQGIGRKKNKNSFITVISHKPVDKVEFKTSFSFAVIITLLSNEKKE